MSSSILSFGPALRGAHYHPRPGGYAVIVNDQIVNDQLVNDQQAVAVVITPGGCFLPGGGLEEGETPMAAACREAREEAGLDILITRRLGMVHELVFAETE
jgi:8-oxo-dGTP pyrophosphatase MutT (NUDIX family)